MTPHAFETCQQVIVQPLMPSLELAHHVGQQAEDSAIADRHYAGNDFKWPLRICRLERTEQNAQVVGLRERCLYASLPRATIQSVGKPKVLRFGASNRLRPPLGVHCYRHYDAFKFRGGKNRVAWLPNNEIALSPINLAAESKSQPFGESYAAKSVSPMRSNRSAKNDAEKLFSSRFPKSW